MKPSAEVFANFVIWLSSGTLFATVVTRRWSSFTVRHGWFGCAVRGLLHGGETCRIRVAERRRAPRTPSCHFAVCLQLSRGPPLRTSVGRHACPTPLAVIVHPALRVGIIGAEMIGHEHIRNVPVFGEVLSWLPLLGNQIGAIFGPTSPLRYQRHRLRLDVVGYQAEGFDRCATLPAA